MFFFQAPEHLGSVIKVLVSSGVLDKVALGNIISGFLETSLKDEFAQPDVIRDAYSRFEAASAI